MMTCRWQSMIKRNFSFTDTTHAARWKRILSVRICHIRMFLCTLVWCCTSTERLGLHECFVKAWSHEISNILEINMHAYDPAEDWLGQRQSIWAAVTSLSQASVCACGDLQTSPWLSPGGIVSPVIRRVYQNYECYSLLRKTLCYPDFSLTGNAGGLII